MNTDGRHTRIPPGVAWCVETPGLLLVRRDTGTRRLLPYPDAALWELLGRGEPQDRVTRMMAAIAGITTPAAETWIAKTLDRWVREGWLEEQHG